MRRPPIGYVLALASAVAATVSTVSYTRPLFGVWNVAARERLIFYVFDGRARIFWLRPSDPEVAVIAYRRPPSIMMARRSDFAPGTPETDAVPLARRIARRRDYWYTTIANAPRVTAFTMQFNVDASIPASATQPAIAGKLNFVRFPMWVPAVLLLAVPVLVVLTGPMRERRRQRGNQCRLCGYHLHGLSEPRCPECGSET